MVDHVILGTAVFLLFIALMLAFSAAQPSSSPASRPTLEAILRLGAHGTCRRLRWSPRAPLTGTGRANDSNGLDWRRWPQGFSPGQISNGSTATRPVSNLLPTKRRLSDQESAPQPNTTQTSSHVTSSRSMSHRWRWISSKPTNPAPAGLVRNFSKRRTHRTQRSPPPTHNRNSDTSSLSKWIAHPYSGKSADEFSVSGNEDRFAFELGPFAPQVNHASRQFQLTFGSNASFRPHIVGVCQEGDLQDRSPANS